MYSRLYENEWTDALDVLTQVWKKMGNGFGYKTPLHCTECNIVCIFTYFERCEDTKEGNWNLQFEEGQTIQWSNET